jgi:gluconokinase
VFAKLAKILPDDLQIIVGGGALYNSPAWLQIITDMLGRESIVSRIREGSARGAALLAFESLGVIKELKDSPLFIERTCYPDAKRHAIYRQTIKRQQRLYEKLIKDDR